MRSTTAVAEQKRSAPSIPGYRTGRLLGFGASGEVWSAVSEHGEEQVALKVLRTDDGERPGERLDRILRETAVLRRLEHDHVIRLRAVEEAAGIGPVLVTDRAMGGSLGALVGARGPLDVGEAVTVLTPLAGALADLHDMGLVHGDVSPGNVLFDGRGRPLLGDLGLATIVGEPVPGAVHGTPGYVDPARLEGAPPSPASDVHGLAAVGWLALTGRPPQPAGERPPLVAVAPHVPVGLVSVLEAALSPDPDARPSARELAARCFDAAPAAPVRLVPTDPAAAAAEVVTHRLRAAAAESRSRVPERPRARGRRGHRTARTPRRTGSAVLLAVAGFVVLAGGAALLPWLVDAGPAAPAVPVPAVEKVASTTGDVPSAVDAALRGDDPRAAVPALAWLRARAFSTGDVTPLQRANAAGGPAFAEDQARMDALESRDVVLEGLGFDVTAVEVLSRDGNDAVVEATVVTLDHRQVSAGGTVVASVPEGGERLCRLVLRRGDAGWQVVDDEG